MDMNKTALTHDVTAAMVLWMEMKGFKPVETEVPVTRGWCADIAGVLQPTQTELIDLKLIERKPTWNQRFSKTAGITRREWSEAAYAAWNAKCNHLTAQTLTAVVEVKTSRGDFRGDRKWSVAVPGDMAFLAVPAGLIREEEWPVGWGIVQVSEASTRMLRPPQVRCVAEFQRLEVIHSIGVRRDHHTRHARLREFQREHRDRENQRKTLTRVDEVIRATTMILRGEHGSVDNVLDRIGTLRTLPQAVKDQLAPFFAMKPPTDEELAADRVQHEARRLEWEAIAESNRARRAAAKQEVTA